MFDSLKMHWRRLRRALIGPPPFPFDPLPPFGTPEAQAEMDRALGPSYVSPNNKLVRMLRKGSAQ